MRINIVSITRQGGSWNRKICELLNRRGHCCKGAAFPEIAEEFGLMPVNQTLSRWTEDSMREADAVVFISAVGIAVRSIAPFIRDKYTDPAVIAMDECGCYVIALLSGHVGGANELAVQIAEEIGAEPVVTTATDQNRCFAVDIFAVKNHLKITDRILAKKISAAVLKGERIGLWSEIPLEGKLSKELFRMEKLSGIFDFRYGIAAGIPAHDLEEKNDGDILWLVPQTIYLGIGCRKGVSAEAVESFVLRQLRENGMRIEQVRAVSSIDRKRNEAGLVEFCEKYQLPFTVFSAKELDEAVGEFSVSEFVKKTVGVENVCERAAVKASKEGWIILSKRAENGITLAAAETKPGFGGYLRIE